MTPLHYSLFSVSDLNGYVHIVSLDSVCAIEFRADTGDAVAILSTGCVYLLIDDGNRLLDAWNKYKHISAAISIPEYIHGQPFSDFLTHLIRLDICMGELADTAIKEINDDLKTILPE